MLEIADAPTAEPSQEKKKPGRPKKSQAAASSSSSSAAPAPAPIPERKGSVRKTIEKHKAETIKQKGIEKDPTNNRSYWAKQNLAYKKPA